jgi:hypothetical protein
MKGIAEMACEKVLKIIEVLHPEGLIKAQLFNEKFCVLWRQIGINHPGNWISGCQTEKQEQNGKDHKKNDNDLNQSPANVSPQFHDSKVSSP